MRRLALVLTLAVTALVAAPAAQADNVFVGHSGWQWGNPQPQGDQLNGIDFAGGTGYAAGNFGTLLKTVDGGQNWTGIATGITGDLQQVRVLNPQTLFIGAGCLLRRSTDGGATFSRLPLTGCTSGTALTSFSFTDADNGYLLLSNGTVLQTTNGGQSFALRTSLPGTAVTGANPGAPPSDIVFTSATGGFATAGGTIFRTTDSGNTWNQVFTNPAHLNGLFFSDANTGYAVGDNKTVEKTTDAGSTWTAKPVPAAIPPGDLTKIRCAPGDSTLCVATTRVGDQFLRTTDGGATWATKKAATLNILALAFNTANDVVGVGQGGATVVSLDGANTFTQVGSSPLAGATFSRLRATSSSVITAPGANGTLARSTDGGHTWTKVGVAGARNVIDASFPNAAIGFALDDAGSLFKSTDGGATWTPADTGGIAAPRAVYAPDPNTVLLIGPRGVVHSTNSGNSFARTGGKAAQKAVLTDFDSTTTGQVVVYGPRALLLSSNKGVAFKALPLPGGKRNNLSSADFVTAKLGYVLDTSGRVWATKNAGKKWSELIGVGQSGGYDMAWGDASNGYLAVRGFGLNPTAGYVLHTSDGGRSWRPQLVSPGEIAGSGLVATAGQTAFALSAPTSLFFTGAGGDQGAASTLTIKASTKKVPRKGAVVTISGKLSPALANENVSVMVRSATGSSWSRLQPKPTSGTGTFTVKRKIRGTTYVVAQWEGDSATNGDGSNVLTITGAKK